MNKSVLDKLSKFEKNVELAEVKVDLAVTDEVASKLKNINDPANYNKLNCTCLRTFQRSAKPKTIISWVKIGH